MPVHIMALLLVATSMVQGQETSDPPVVIVPNCTLFDPL